MALDIIAFELLQDDYSRDKGDIIYGKFLFACIKK
jgi:hypothetical protein